MGQPLSEEAKRKISEAFARRREEKAKMALEPTQTTGKSQATKQNANLISIPLEDRDGHSAMGRRVQAGEAKWHHYANDCSFYEIRN